MSHTSQQREIRTIWDRLTEFVHPVAFGAGLVLGFLALYGASRWSVNSVVLRDHVRFTEIGHREGLWYPTADHVLALAKERSSGNAICVIVGGSSICNGYGQHVSKLWSRHLQDLLGGEYVVLNLAGRGGRPNECGAWTTEYLIGQGRKVIYFTDTPVQSRLQPTGIFDRSLYFDFLVRGYLMDHPERSAGVWRQRKMEDGYRSEEMLAGAWINRLTGCQDLWAGIGYAHFFTVWSRLTGKAPLWTARKKFPDHVPLDPPLYPHPNADEMRTVRASVARKIGRGGKPIDYYYGSYIPQPVRSRMIGAIVPNSPFYTSQLSSMEKEYCRLGEERMKSHLLDHGIRVLDMPLLATEDFVDRCHLSASGGRKMAEAAAPAIQALAKELGYVAP